MELEARVEARVNQGLLGRWYVIAKSADLPPGSRPLAVKALGRELVLWRSANSQLNCVEDRCPHRGARLSCGEVRGEHIACRYHGVTVDREGVIVSVPALGKSGLEGRKAIASYVVREARNGVFLYVPSVEHPVPRNLPLPLELTDSEYTSFLCTAVWECSYRYVVENLVDPMHGIYLHADTFTLAGGATKDKVEVEQTERGFIVKRVGQQGINLDWIEMISEPPLVHARVIIPYPAAGGPGGPMIVIACTTPIDQRSCHIFFWRTRKVAGVERELWRFLFRTTFEAHHWSVLEQDRALLSAMPDDARERELLYQHDAGVVRIRKLLVKQAQAQLEAEDAAAAGAAIQPA